MGPWPKLVLVDRPDAPQAVIARRTPRHRRERPERRPSPRARTSPSAGSSRRGSTRISAKSTATATAPVAARLHARRGRVRRVGRRRHREDDGRAQGAPRRHRRLRAQRPDATPRSRRPGRSRARTYVETFEGVDRAAAQLALDASLGLGPDFERVSASRKDAATKAELDAAGQAALRPVERGRVVVGPRAKLEGPLARSATQDIQLRDAEGSLVKPAGEGGAEKWRPSRVQPVIELAPGAENNGFATMLADLVRQNLEAKPHKVADFDAHPGVDRHRRRGRRGRADARLRQRPPRRPRRHRGHPRRDHPRHRRRHHGHVEHPAHPRRSASRPPVRAPEKPGGGRRCREIGAAMRSGPSTPTGWRSTSR